MNNESILESVKEEVLAPNNYIINNTEVIVINTPSFTYGFPEDDKIMLNWPTCNKEGSVKTIKGAYKFFKGITYETKMNLIKSELEYLCDGWDYLIIYDILKTDMVYYENDKERPHYNLYIRYVEINKPKGVEKPIHERSNKKVYNDKITTFLYLLMRDELLTGKVEELVQEVENTNGDIKFSNGWLAEYANDITKRLQ